MAARDGTVWIADITTGHTIYTGRILANDRVTLDPSANVLTLNGQPIQTPQLAQDRYAVYFAAR